MMSDGLINKYKYEYNYKYCYTTCGRLRMPNFGAQTAEI